MEYGEIETEWVLSQDPDVIVGRAMGAGIRPYENLNDTLIQKYAQQIRSLPGFDNVSAVKNDRVYIITKYLLLDQHYMPLEDSLRPLRSPDFEPASCF